MAHGLRSAGRRRLRPRHDRNLSRPNGDGHPEALVTEGGTFCYGNTGTGFWLLGKQASGAWKVLFQSQGMAEFLKTTGAAKMPDISVGGPGFCFPVVRWNGKEYVQNRYEYEGKACKPSE